MEDFQRTVKFLDEGNLLSWRAATWCQTLHICVIRRECCPRTAGFPTWQINTREMPGRCSCCLYLERCHKPWYLIRACDMQRGFHCELCKRSDRFGLNESPGTPVACDEADVASDKVVKIKQQGCRIYEQQQGWCFSKPRARCRADEITRWNKGKIFDSPALTSASSACKNFNLWKMMSQCATSQLCVCQHTTTQYQLCWAVNAEHFCRRL